MADAPIPAHSTQPLEAPLPLDEASPPAAAAAADSRPVDGSLSVPLYISAYISMIAALAAVNSGVGDSGLAASSILLATLGFVFSYVCRWASVPSRWLNWLAGLVALFLFARLATGGINIGALIPNAAQQTDLQVAVLLDWVSVLYAWTLNDDRKVILSSILAMAMIGLVASADVNADLVVFFFVYVLATIFLLLHQNYLLHRGWGEARARSATDARLVRVQLALSVVCAIVALLIGLVLVVPLQAIGGHLSLGAALKGLNYFAPTAGGGGAVEYGGNSGQDGTDLDDGTSFAIGQGGDGFSTAKTVAMRVAPSDGQEHYWRGRTYDRYTQHGWVSTEDAYPTRIPPRPDLTMEGVADYQFPVYQGPGTELDTSSHAPVFSSTFHLVKGQLDTIYAPANPVGLRLAGYDNAILFALDGQIGVGDSLSRVSYMVIAQEQRVTLKQLRATPVAQSYPEPIQQLYVDMGRSALSPTDALRLSRTAQAIVATLPASRRDEFDEAEAIRAWVSHRCVYSLDVDPVPIDQDAVSYFLFKSRIGYCDLFASSMAVLCRYAGLPARVASGFDPGERQADGTFDLRFLDKHAWCEVYFPGHGWQIFDPTSGTAVAPGNQGTRGLVAALRGALRGAWRFLTTSGPIPLALAGAALLASGYAVKVELIDKKRDRGGGSGSGSGALTAAGFMGGDAGGEDSDLRRALAARRAAEERWGEAHSQLHRWKLRQRPYESAREYARRAAAALVAASACAAPESRAQPVPDAAAAASGLRALGEDYLVARYAPLGDPLPRLVERDASGAAERERADVTAFLQWARRHARAVGAREDDAFLKGEPAPQAHAETAHFHTTVVSEETSEDRTPAAIS